MELDLRTLFFTLMTVELMLAAVLVLFWKTQAVVPGLARVTFASLVAIVASVLTAFRGTVPVPVSILAGNLGFAIAFLLALRGFQEVRGVSHRRPFFEAAILVLMALGLGYFTFVDFDTATRIIIGESLFAAMCLVGAIDLFRERRPDLRAASSFVAVLFVIYGIALAMSVVTTFFAGAETDYLQTRGPFTALAILVTLTSVIGWTLGFLWIAYDMSQACLRKVEKLDAIGRLAGGIAHELNNILTPVVGLTSSILHDMEATDRRRGRLEMVLRAGNRAAELVGSILTFGQRQDAMMPVKIDIAAIVRDVLDAQWGDLPDNLTATATIDDATGFVVADADYIRLVLGNLISNAVDAMEGGPGRLEISLAATAIPSKTQADALGVAPGSYARLTVADTGPGMNEATLNQAIDPFFTTKAVGKGTGLGLSMVNGIAAMAGGALRLSSLPGQGTTAEVYLPLAGEQGSG